MEGLVRHLQAEQVTGASYDWLISQLHGFQLSIGGQLQVQLVYFAANWLAVRCEATRQAQVRAGGATLRHESNRSHQTGAPAAFSTTPRCFFLNTFSTTGWRSFFLMASSRGNHFHAECSSFNSGAYFSFASGDTTARNTVYNFSLFFPLIVLISPAMV
mmetsp:Transcript_4307/g.12415  ORF Transcript_4307/g.12415 Transcript_4307/m.12415 type:complete len:159 (+) Transcript_4307:566-1042(+)